MYFKLTRYLSRCLAFLNRLNGYLSLELGCMPLPLGHLEILQYEHGLYTEGTLLSSCPVFGVHYRHQTMRKRNRTNATLVVVGDICHFSLLPCDFPRKSVIFVMRVKRQFAYPGSHYFMMQL